MGDAVNPYESRFQDIESVLLQLANSQKQLLHAQVIMSDIQDRTTQQLEKVITRLDDLAKAVDKLATGTEAGFAECQKQILQVVEAQKHSDARLDALISVVDDLVRKNGKRGNKPQ